MARATAGRVRPERGRPGGEAERRHAGSLLIKAGFVEVMTLPLGTTHVAAVCDTGTSTIEFTRGIGQ